jgi:hypothetical protein
VETVNISPPQKLLKGIKVFAQGLLTLKTDKKISSLQALLWSLSSAFGGRTMGRSQEAKVLLLGPTCDNCLRNLPAQFLMPDAKDENCCALVVGYGKDNVYLIRYYFPPEKHCESWEEKKEELFRRERFHRVRKFLRSLLTVKVGISS